MGDKSPKAKQKKQGQQSKAKADGETKAHAKQDSYSQIKPLGSKTKP